MKKRIQPLNTTERKIMKIIWASKQPLTSRDIQKLSNGEFSEKALYPLITSLIEKGFIKVVGSIILPKSKKPSRLITAKVSPLEYLRHEIHDLAGVSLEESEVSTVMSYFNMGYDKDDNFMEEVKAWIDEQERDET